VLLHRRAGAAIVATVVAVLVIQTTGSLAAKVVPTPLGPAGVALAVGPGHSMWFSGGRLVENTITPGYSGPAYTAHTYLGYFHPDGSATIVSHQQWPGNAAYLAPNLLGAVLGPDGNFWALPGRNFVRTTPAGAVSEVPSLLHGEGGQQIIDGPDGNMWFTTTERENGVGRLRPSGAVTIFSAGVPGRSESITVGPDGALWFTTSTGKLGHISTAGQVRVLPIRYEMSLVVKGADGNLWVTTGGRSSERILRVTPSGRVTKMCRNEVSSPLISGPRSSIWFSVSQRSIARMDRRGNVYIYRIPKGKGRIIGSVIAGPEGDVWFTAVAHEEGTVMRIDPSEASTQVCRAP
jgi:streptogramin lyase